MNDALTTSTHTALNAGPALGPSLLQAVAALLVVIGLIFLTSYLLRRFAFNGQLANGLGSRLQRGKAQRTLAVTESLWIDARHRLIVIGDAKDATQRYTLLIGPQHALQLHETPPRSDDAPSLPSKVL